MAEEQTLAHYRRLLSILLYSLVSLVPLQVALFAVFPHPATIVGWFALFRDNPLVGFIGFDVVYLLSNVLMVFAYISLLVLLKDRLTPLMIFAFVLAFVSMTIYFSSNRSIEMYGISSKYFEAVTEAQKASFIAAGELLLSVYKGTAYFVYYVLNGLSLILLFRSFQSTGLFSQRTMVAGMVSGFLMLVPATVGIVGMVFSLVSLVPWMATCLSLASDMRTIRQAGSRDGTGRRDSEIEGQES